MGQCELAAARDNLQGLAIGGSDKAREPQAGTLCGRSIFFSWGRRVPGSALSSGQLLGWKALWGQAPQPVSYSLPFK